MKWTLREQNVLKTGAYLLAENYAREATAHTIRWDPILNYPGSMVGGVGST